MAAYQAEYETQANKVVGLPYWFLLEVFISELREDIQLEVLKFRPPDIQEAMVLAKTVEAQILGSKSSYARDSKKFSGGISSFYKKPFQPLANKTPGGEESQNKPRPTKFLNFKRLNVVERRARREKGLCFNCDEKFSVGHHCKGRLFKLFADETELWEVQSDEDEIEEVDCLDGNGEVTTVSLNAMEGNLSNNTIRMKGTLHNFQVSVLIDTGSTLFLQERLAHKLHLDVSPTRPFLVTTGGGEKLHCSKVSRKTPLKMGEITLYVDLFLIELVGTNIILDMQWLKSLGLVSFQFQELSMQFYWGGKTICWKGEPWVDDNPLSSDELKSLLGTTNEAFMCFMELNEKESEKHNPHISENQKISDLISRYEEVFATPTSLPPKRK